MRLDCETDEDNWEIEALLDTAFGPGRKGLSAYRLREGVDPVASLSLVSPRQVWNDFGHNPVLAGQGWRSRVCGTAAWSDSRPSDEAGGGNRRVADIRGTVEGAETGLAPCHTRRGSGLLLAFRVQAVSGARFSASDRSRKGAVSRAEWQWRQLAGGPGEQVGDGFRYRLKADRSGIPVRRHSQPREQAVRD